MRLAETDSGARVRIDQFQHRSQHELYDLTVDPFEKTNIADRPENVELLELLQTQLSDWRTRQGDDVPVYLEGEYVAPNSN